MKQDDFSISPEVFVEEFKGLKAQLVESYFSADTRASRLAKLRSAGFDDTQLELTQALVGEVLTDALYTVLLGLEGSAAISQHQIAYKLFDEAGNELTGDLDSLAWEAFHGEDS